MARRTRAEAEETRSAILDAAEREFLARGVSRTTLDHIARSADVTRGAIYWHFKDKSDVFSAMIDRVRLPLTELADRVRSEMVERDPLSLCERMCKLVLARLAEDERYRNVYTILFTRCEFVAESNPAVDRQLQLEREVVAQLKESFRRARELGHLKTSVEPCLAALSLFTFLQGLFLCWLRQPALFDPRVDGEIMLERFFCSLRV